MLQRRLQSGFTYLAVLFFLAVLGGGLALTGEIWHTAAQREKEAELLFIGSAYRSAIERYVRAGQGAYPRNLDDLLKDPRQPATARYLRKAYVDPMTGKSEWGVVKAPDGGIMGVHSLSEEKPLKVANFRLVHKGFDNVEKYTDWRFVYVPLAKPAAAKPSLKPDAKPEIKAPAIKP
jgi:type II secretory pathway pseudopilin PulG